MVLEGREIKEGSLVGRATTWEQLIRLALLDHSHNADFTGNPLIIRKTYSLRWIMPSVGY